MEGEKPRTPGRMQLMLEELGEEVKIPEENELRERLSTVFITPEARDKFLPRLLQHAGREVSVSEVVSIIVGAMRNHTADEGEENMRYFFANYSGDILEAMIPDAKKFDKAERFLQDALNG